MKRRRRTTLDHLLTGERRWERLEATIIVGRTASDLAEGEADLLRYAKQAEVSVEFMAGTDNLRVYRLGGSDR